MPNCPTNFEACPPLKVLAVELERLERLLANTPRLHVKDVLARYGWSSSTLYRRLKARRFPRPVHQVGSLWRLEDLERAELAGQLPRTQSGQPLTQSRTGFCPVSA